MKIRRKKKAEPSSYDNSKDALSAIIKQFGADKLLGKLNAIFPDFAPSVDNKIKKLVYTVYDSGASKVLKENLNGSQEDKERAVKIAIRNMTENFIVSEIAENIIYEFIDTLGWKIKKAESTLSKEDETKTPASSSTATKKTAAKKPASTSSVVKKPQAATEPIKSGSSASEKPVSSQPSSNSTPVVKKRSPEEIEKIRIEAEKGDLDSINKLARMYFLGDEVPKNYIIAKEWFEKAAALGDNEAMREISSLNSLIAADEILKNFKKH